MGRLGEIGERRTFKSIISRSLASSSFRIGSSPLWASADAGVVFEVSGEDEAVSGAAE